MEKKVMLTSARALIGGQPVAPSPIPCPRLQEIPHALRVIEIREIVEEFGDCALRGKESRKKKQTLNESAITTEDVEELEIHRNKIAAKGWVATYPFGLKLYGTDFFTHSET